jgi:hypothetical protein
LTLVIESGADAVIEVVHVNGCVVEHGPPVSHLSWLPEPHFWTPREIVTGMQEFTVAFVPFTRKRVTELGVVESLTAPGKTPSGNALQSVAQGGAVVYEKVGKYGGVPPSNIFMKGCSRTIW